MAISTSSRRAPSAARHLIVSLAAAGVTMALASASAFAVSGTYTGTAADGLFATPTNWDLGSAPGTSGYTGSTDTATFRNATPAAVTVDANRNVQNLTINQSGGTPPTYTISGGPFLLTSGGTILVTATSVSQNISTPLVLEGDGGTYAIETDTPGTSRTLTLGGAINGVSTAGNTTVLTLTGTSAGTNAINGSIGDGATGGKLAIVKTGAGTYNLNGTDSYSGGTTVTAGTLVTGNATPSTTLGSGGITLNGGTLRLSASSSTFTNALATTANGGFISVKGGAFNPAAITGAGAFTIGIDSAGTYTPSTFQQFAGTVNVTANAGAVNLRLGTNVTTGAFDGTSLQNAALNLGAGVTVARGFATNGLQSAIIGTLSGVAGSSIGGTSGTGTGTGTFAYSVGGRNEDSTFAGAIVAAANGATTTFAKTGTGTLTLTGTNTYTGATTITGGTLALSGGGSIANSASIAIGAAGTLDTTAASFTLGGTQALALAGTFKGTLAANATTTITPGGIGVVGAANVNNTTLAGGATFTADLSGATADALNVAGTIDLAGATLALNDLASPTTVGQVYTIVANDGTDPTLGTFAGLADGTILTAGVDQYQLNYNALGGNDVTLTALTAAATPEPASLAAVGLAGSLLLKRRRRAC